MNGCAIEDRLPKAAITKISGNGPAAERETEQMVSEKSLAVAAGRL